VAACIDIKTNFLRRSQCSASLIVSAGYRATRGVLHITFLIWRDVECHTGWDGAYIAFSAVAGKADITKK
jgi:hypothetical protein